MGGEFNGKRYDVWSGYHKECGVWDNDTRQKVYIRDWALDGMEYQTIYAPDYESAKEMARKMNRELEQSK